MHKSLPAAAAGAALALTGLALPVGVAGADVTAPVYLQVAAGEPVLPGGKVTVTGSVGEGCSSGRFRMFQEYWPKPGTTGSTIIEHAEEGAPVEGEDHLVVEEGGRFTAVLGVPADATRSNLYGEGPGEVPHYLWVEVTGCESGAWKRASDRFGATVPVQPVSTRTELAATPRTVTAGESLTVTAVRCHGAVAKAWAQVGRTTVLAATTAFADGLMTATFDIPDTAGSDPSATATVLCTQSQTADNRNSVGFAVQAAPADTAPGEGATGGGSTGGGSGSGGSGSGDSGSGSESGTGSSTVVVGGSGSASTGVVVGTSGTAASGTATGGTTGGSTTTTRVAKAATPVSGTVTYAG